MLFELKSYTEHCREVIGMLYPDITKIQPKHNIMWTFGVCWEFTFSFGGNSQSIVYFYCTVLFLTKQMGCDFPLQKLSTFTLTPIYPFFFIQIVETSDSKIKKYLGEVLGRVCNPLAGVRTLALWVCLNTPILLPSLYFLYYYHVM